ncbi:MAG: hypothetical protein FJW40_07680 [Acidobacteria bacterium]|nr:hypothetical protein [Acidobacteriota bacterium]
MSIYQQQPFDLSGLNTIPIRDRGGKVRIEHMARVYRKGSGLAALIEGLPGILAADSFRAVLAALRRARDQDKPIIWGMGGHVVKCGLAPTLLHLMRRGYATAFAMNGSTSIHDFEIAIAGCTSEDVESVLPDGRFGSAEETGREMNQAIAAGAARGCGIGESLGARLHEIAVPEFAPFSLLHQAYEARVPVTVHVAMGTDTPHTFPQADGAAIGAATHHDFRLFCSLVAALHQGGVYINLGSAVVLPEVFLKAVSVVRNVGVPLREFTTVNFDFLQHYRPRANVVSRPHANAGGEGHAITGHHELMVPLLAAALIELDDRE